jgi:ribosome-binding factor A
MLRRALFMANFKTGRVSEDIRRELSALIKDLKDPRIAGGMLTVMRCDLSNDMSHCKVYISSFEGYEKAKEAVKGFESASGYIKREISNALHLRKCPEFKFIADDSTEHSVHINKMLKEIAKQEEQKQEIEEEKQDIEEYNNNESLDD